MTTEQTATEEVQPASEGFLVPEPPTPELTGEVGAAEAPAESEEAPLADAETLRAQLEEASKELQRLRSNEGRVRSQAEKDNELSQILRSINGRMSLMEGRLEDPLADPEEYRQRKGAMAQAEVAQQGLVQANGLYGSVLDMQKELTDEYGVNVLEDERFKEPLSMWVAGVENGNHLGMLANAERAFARAHKDVLKEQLAAEKKEKARKTVDEQRQDGTMRTPRAGGTAGPVSDNAFIEQYAAGDSDDHARYRKVAKARGWMS